MERKKYLKRKKMREESRNYFVRMRENDPEKYEAYKEKCKIRRRIEHASGRGPELEKKRKERKRRILKNKKFILEIDGVTLYEKKMVINEKINHLNPRTFANYVSAGIIPQPIYKKSFVQPWGKFKEYTRWYYSARQIKLLNTVFGRNKTWKSRSLEERREYLHANWTKGELGFGGESTNGGANEQASD